MYIFPALEPIEIRTSTYFYLGNLRTLFTVHDAKNDPQKQEQAEGRA